MFRLGLIIAVSVLAADQLSKYLLIGLMSDIGGRLEILPFFNLVMVWNRGISFGLFASGETGRWLLTLMSLAIVIGLTIWLWRLRQKLLAVAIGALIGGALGNIVDRVYHGAVADFFDFHFFGYHWPAFNIADSAITVAAAMVIFDALFLSSSDGEGKKGSRDDVK